MRSLGFTAGWRPRTAPGDGIDADDAAFLVGFLKLSEVGQVNVAVIIEIRVHIRSAGAGHTVIRTA